MSTSRAVARNRDLRAAVRAAFPGTRFTVRNGRNGHAAICWTDGPSAAAVREVTRAVPSDQDGQPWARDTERRVTAQLTAVAVLRAREQGVTFYTEWDADGAQIEPGRPGPEQAPRAEWRVWDDEVDGLRVAAAEEARAQVLVLLAGVDRDEEATSDGRRQAARRIARALYHYAPAVDAAVAEPAR